MTASPNPGDAPGTEPGHESAGIPATDPADDSATEPGDALLPVSWPAERIAPAGRAFIVFGGDESAQLYVSLDGEVREIGSLPDVDVNGEWPLAALAPDGAHVAVIPDYSNAHGTKLMLLTADGDVVFAKDGLFSSVAWHPEGRAVAAVRLYHERRQDPLIATVVQYALDGSETVVTADAPYVQEVLGYSPDGAALYVTYFAGPIETTPRPGLNFGQIDVATGQLTELLASDWPDGDRYLAIVRMRTNDGGQAVMTFNDRPPRRTKARLGILLSDTNDIRWIELQEMAQPWTVTSEYIWGGDDTIAWLEWDQVWVMQTGSDPVHIATLPAPEWHWVLDSLTADGDLWLYNCRHGYVRLDATAPGQASSGGPAG